MTPATAWMKKAIVIIGAVFFLVLVYLAIRWSDPGACPGLQALDPTCMRIYD